MRKSLLLLISLFCTSASAQTYTPSGASPTENLVFSWPANPAATAYNLYIGQYGADTIYNLTPTQAGCASGVGQCSYNPGVTCSPQQGQGICSQGHTITWWIDALASGVLLSDTANQAYIPFSGQAETVVNDYKTNYDFAWDATPCTKWTYVNNFIGGQRRVIDISIGSGTQNLGIQMFHQALWSLVDISDLVPTGPNGARVARLKAEVGYSASCANAAAGATCNLMGWAIRRHGTTEQNIPVLQYYTSAERDFKEFDVLLDQNGRFDFYWDDGANGIYPKVVNNATITGEFINATIIGYCTP